ncbi:MAG: metallophosphoesterase family protein [Actinobacteria bacterium]|nr:MAG: metallophosphoesterase family protein [Actinomycetota bacterium]
MRQRNTPARNHPAARATTVVALANRVAVISDVHANWHALEAVLAAVDAEQPDELWCLGELTVSDFNDEAAAAAVWTSKTLTDESRTFLRGLEPKAEADGVELFHASARDPVWEYVLSEEAAHATFELTSSPLVLVGHSHVPLALALAGGTLGGGLAPDATEAELGTGARLLLNSGSVGQPRDGDPRAAWLLLDFAEGRASFRRVAYPVEKAQAEIRERGLPHALAERLARGV